MYAPPREPQGSAGVSLQLGGLNVSVGGAAGTGVYRGGEGIGASVQADGIRDGVRNLFGKVRQGVERIGGQ